MHLSWKAVNEWKPDDDKEQEEKNDEESEDCQPCLQRWAYLALDWILEGLDKIFHMRCDKEPLNVK